MWSGPRALSTALMRAWENRPDCLVVDEPLYAAYLAATGLDHPMRAAVLAAQAQDAGLVARRMTTMTGAPIIYQKHMSHHLLPTMPRDWVDRLANAFLIRDPARVLASYDRKRPAPTLADIGIGQQGEVFDRLADRDGRAPPVIDADDLQRAPETVLRALCRALGVPFRAEMLAWPAGPRASDGVWAPHWYDAVWRSTGFGPPRERATTLAPALARLAEQARPLYERLARHRLAAA
ncbi:MAG: HAD family hydrolase [Alphaproteobacteria bacterium]|nr:HAD family hydrolase [Alphaproteobacteria bacterium]MCB9929011.1 HAD family hydrolase [Alphaproteobacteria bacterium]